MLAAVTAGKELSWSDPQNKVLEVPLEEERIGWSRLQTEAAAEGRNQPPNKRMSLINQVELPKATLKLQDPQSSQYWDAGRTCSKGFDMAQRRLCGSMVVLQRIGYFQALICLLNTMEKIAHLLPQYQWKLICVFPSWTKKPVLVLSNDYHIWNTFRSFHFRLAASHERCCLCNISTGLWSIL